MTEKLRDLVAEAEANALSIHAQGEITIRQPVGDPLVVFSSAQEEVIRVTGDGRCLWKGREVETDAEFLALAKECMRRVFGVGKIEVTAEMVSRFLCMPLPRTFSPDGGISFDRRKDQWNPNPSWPVGTNLFTAEETKAILEHVLNGG